MNSSTSRLWVERSSDSTDEMIECGNNSVQSDNDLSMTVLSVSTTSTLGKRYGLSPISDDYLVDSLGRLVLSDAVATDRLVPPSDKKELARESRRIEKWMNMLSKWPDYQLHGKHWQQTKSRARKGIPDQMRAKVYSRMLRIEELAADKGIGYYTTLLDHSGPIDEVIRRDLHRTNPGLFMFQELGGLGQESLFNVLRAYAFHDTDVSYCQGMGTFVSILLTYAVEEHVFWMLTSLLQGPFLIREYYTPTLVGLRKAFFVFEKCLERFLPKLALHLAKEGYTPPIYASRWFCTLCGDLPLECTLRVWDVMLNDGPKILYRVGLAILKVAKPQLMEADMENFPDILNDVQRTLNAEDLISLAIKFRLRRRFMHRCETQFESLQCQV